MIPRSYDNFSEERAWKIPSFLAASLTIEAALGLTIFLIFVVSLSQLFLVMQLQLRMQKALEQVGNEAAQYAYFSDQIKWWERESKLLAEVEEYLLAELSEEALEIRLVDLMGEEALEQSVIRGGAQGISLEESRLLREQHRLHLVVTYQIDLPVTWLGLEPITLRQQCYRYAWLGDQPPSRKVQKEEQMVYVTKTGEVYHLSLDCTYLTLSIRQITRDQLETLRNDSGAKYYSCELCEPPIWETQLYITREGTRFHSEKDCSGLRRYISALPISQVGSRHVCSRCQEKE